jgi:hypothetical protein
MRPIPSSPALLSLALLSGCATAARSTAIQRAEPDCSFRSAATCWTVAGRFPPRRTESAVPKPDEIRDPSPAVLASETDSVSSDSSSGTRQ